MMDFDDFGYDEAAYWLEPDMVLTNIVSALVNMLEIPVGVTVSMRGMVISGTLVSERQYLKLLTETFTSMAKRSVDPKDKDEIEAIEDAFDFTELAEGWYPQTPAQADEDKETSDTDTDDDEDNEDFPFKMFEPEELPPPIRHLHLTDITVLTPQPGITFSQSAFPIMRIRLTAIDGWMLGQASPVDDVIGDDSASGTVLH